MTFNTHAAYLYEPAKMKHQFDAQPPVFMWNEGSEMNNPEDVVEIKDPEIDVTVIMEKIRQGIESRRSLYAEKVFFPSLRDPNSSGLGAKYLSKEFNYELQEALACHDQTWVSVQLLPTRFPVVGPALARVKKELHNLVVFYVNLLASKQVSFNAHSARAVAALSEIVGTRASSMELEQLRWEVQQLREQVERLENQLNKATSTNVEDVRGG